MDLAQFQVIRSPNAVRSRELEVKGRLLVPELVELISHGSDYNLQDMQTLGADRLANAADPVVSATLGNPDTIEQCVYWVLARLDEELAAQSDKVSGEEWRQLLAKIEDPYRVRFGTDAWSQAFEETQKLLEDWLAQALLSGDLGRAADLTRLWALLHLISLSDTDELTAAQTQATLAQIPHFPVTLAALFAKASIQLVREASIGDLFVVRSEWREYVRGDIAGIKNVLPGELYERTLKRTQELESTQTSEASTQTSAESETKTSEESEMSQETSNQLRVEINGFVRAEVSGSYGAATVKVSGGVEGRVSLDQANRQASRIARSATNRAVSKVDTLTREARVRRELSRTEDTVHEALTNDTTEFVRGIYRWLDRIDRYQIVRYPDRLQLEFQLPEPGEYLRWRAKQKKARDGLGAPPEWTLELSDITEDAAALFDLAKKFRAVNLPTLPAAEVSVVHALKAEAKGVPSDANDALAVPMANEEAELLVPGGYEATEVKFSGIAVPVWGVWPGELPDGSNWGRRIGWHGSVVTVVLAGIYKWSSNQRNLSVPPLRDDAVVRALGWDENRVPRFGNAVTELNGGTSDVPITVTLDPPAVAKVKTAVQGAGVSAVHVSFAMKCRRSAQAYAAWRQAVYDALFEAWNQWKREWETAQSAAAELQLIAGEGSAAKIEELLRNEVKRQVIAWLLEASPFQGMDALMPPAAVGTAAWREIDFDRARTSAPIIQFFEQAFEWGNLGYILYPYFWADRSRWDELNDITSANPDYERFLKAGSARVVVPARPAMAVAVLHWLVFREPFLGRPLPLPGHPMYVSLAKEIRDLTQPPTDGVPGDSWEAKVGTSLLWLEESDELPTNELSTLGKAPNEPDPRLTSVE